MGLKSFSSDPFSRSLEIPKEVQGSQNLGSWGLGTNAALFLTEGKIRFPRLSRRPAKSADLDVFLRPKVDRGDSHWERQISAKLMVSKVNRILYTHGGEILPDM